MRFSSRECANCCLFSIASCAFPLCLILCLSNCHVPTLASDANHCHLRRVCVCVKNTSIDCDPEVTYICTQNNCMHHANNWEEGRFL